LRFDFSADQSYQPIGTCISAARKVLEAPSLLAAEHDTYFRLAPSESQSRLFSSVRLTLAGQVLQSNTLV